MAKEIPAKRKALFDKTKKKADSAYNRGSLEEALALYRTANSIVPAQEIILQRISEIEPRVQRLESNKALHAKARQLLRRNDFAGARAVYDELLALDPNDKQVQQAVSDLEKKMEDHYGELVLEGDRLFEEQQYDAAAACYQEAANYYPDDEYSTKRLNESLTLAKRTKVGSKVARYGLGGAVLIGLLIYFYLTSWKNNADSDVVRQLKENQTVLIGTWQLNDIQFITPASDTLLANMEANKARILRGGVQLVFRDNGTLVENAMGNVQQGTWNVVQDSMLKITYPSGDNYMQVERINDDTLSVIIGDVSEQSRYIFLKQ